MSKIYQACRSCHLVLVASLLGALVALFAARPAPALAAGTTFYVSPSGSDANSGTSADAPFGRIQAALDIAQPGDVIVLAPGEYYQDVVSRRDGVAGAPITLTGPRDAVVRGAGGSQRIFEINHDYLTLDGFTIDGLAGPPNRKESYRNKLVYVVGIQPGNGVTGLRVLNMTFRNAGGECMRLRYFAQHNEIGFSTFQDCGVYDFRFNDGGKNGEAIYIGTAPEQRGNGKSPTADPDHSNNNWIHHNFFNTQGNECVDIKEDSSGNIVEYNVCTGQRDPKSGGFDARGNNNVFRYNQSFGNAGAGFRLGGDKSSDGASNAIYGNSIYGNQSGDIKVQRGPQDRVCGNEFANGGPGDVRGKKPYRTQLNPAAPCP